MNIKIKWAAEKKATELRKKEFDDETPGLNCTASLLTCCDLISIC